MSKFGNCKVHIGIIVPTLNVEDTLHQFIVELSKIDLASKVTVVFIDNGSTDNTNKIFEENRGMLSNYNVHHIKNGKNLGYGFSLKAGARYLFDEVDVTYAATMHPDLQFKTSEVFEYIFRFTQGNYTDFDVCYFERVFVFDKKISLQQLFRSIGNITLAILNGPLIQSFLRDINSPFMILSKRIYNSYIKSNQLTSGIFIHPQLNLLVLGFDKWNNFLKYKIEWKRAPKTVSRPLIPMGITLIRLSSFLLRKKLLGKSLNANDYEIMNEILISNETRRYL